MTFGIQLFDQRGHLFTHADIRPRGWSPMPDIHAGVSAHDEGLIFENACPGAGELYLDRIEIDFGSPVRGVLPTARWHVDGSKLTIGAGGEFIPVRGRLHVRWGYPKHAPASVRYGPATVSWSPLQRRDVMGAMLASRANAYRLTGMIPTAGEFQTAPPGGTNRNSVAGWEQDAAGMVERSDQWMNRMHIGCCDQASGVPIQVSDGSYNLVVGKDKSTTLDAFCKGFAIYDDRREPRVTLPGKSGFAAMLRGDDRDNCQSTMDGQHRGNALGAVRAAAQCGDSMAIRDLEVLANDAAMASDDPVSLPLGERDMAWRIDAWAHARTGHSRAKLFAFKLATFQTPSGAFLRAPDDYPFSPRPLDYGSPPGYDWDSLMYRWLCCYALGLFGKKDTIRRALEGSPWPAPKFVAVGRGQVEVFDSYRFPCGPPDYFGHLGIGCLAALDKSATDWHTWACKQPTPDGSVHGDIASLRGSLRHATRGLEQTAVLQAVLEEILA